MSKMKFVYPEEISPDALKKYPVYFQHGYLKYQESETIRCLYAQDQEGNLIPLRLYKKSVFSTIQLLYTPWNETLGQLSPDAEIKFIVELVSFLKKNKHTDALLAPLHVCLFKQAYPSIQSQKLGITYVDISNTEDVIFSGFSKTYRTQIRQCEKEGFSINHSENYLQEFFENYKYHHIRQGKSYESIENMRKMLGLLPNFCRLISVVNGEGIWEGGVLLLYDRFKGYYFIGAKAENRTTHNGSQKFLHWNIMKFLKEKQVETYNLGGYRFNLDANDKFQSIQDFKTKFGAKIEEGFHFNIILSVKYTIFQSLIKLKNKIR
jgi:lipid II:glycine glycyltransferase (peptidoglycan interpeptide bridge formation enzyme)